MILYTIESFFRISIGTQLKFLRHEDKDNILPKGRVF